MSEQKKNKEEVLTVLKGILERDGELKPDRVIEEAQNPTSPLHDYFTWDIEKAAKEHWRDQARQLISSFEVRLVVNRIEYRVSEFVENPLKANRPAQGYVSFSSVRNSPDMAREFLDRELRTAATFINKAITYASLLGLEGELDQLVQQVESIRQTVRPEEEKESEAELAPQT